MANTLLLKRSAVAGKIPVAADLQVGELAVNLADAMLYTKRADNTVIPVGSIAPCSHTYVRTTFTATAGQTTFTVSYNPALLEVYVNGVLLARTDYTATNGTSIVLGSAAELDDVVEVVAFTVYNLNTVLSSNIIGTIPISAGGTNATTAADARTNLGLGTAATTNSIAYATSAQGTLADNAISAVTSTDSSVTITTTGTSKNLSVSYSGLVGAVPTWNQNTTGTSAGLSSTLVIASGGTGQTTANAAFNALAPSQTGNTGKILSTNGTDTSWVVMTDPTDIAISMAIALG